MKILSVWDNGGVTFDRYTVVLDEVNGPNDEKTCLGLSANPNSAQGFSQFCLGVEGNHLGKKIVFESLSEDIQEHILKRIEE